MLICDQYLTPASLDEAFAAMAEHRGRHRIVAGATDTLPWAREGRAGDVEIPVLIDVSKIPELNERRVDGKRVRIGAATPIQRFLDDAALCSALPAMPRCAVWFADDQIRESATIGGNIVNASPAGDAIPPLIAHEAVVELASRRNGKIAQRKIPLIQFITGPGKTALQPDELLVAIECDDAERLRRQLREGRPPPLAGDLARLPGCRGEAGQHRPRFRRCPTRDRRHRPGAGASVRSRELSSRRSL